MPTYEALKKLFPNGYNSGDVLATSPSPRRLIEEIRCGANYREVFLKGVEGYLRPDFKVMELGPGNGSWSRPVLQRIYDGELHAVDMHDVSKWIKPKPGSGKLVCYQVSDNSFSQLPDSYFDFFFSFGVLCHNNAEHRSEILANSLKKMKPGALAWHMIGDWKKLEALNWAIRYGVSSKFKDMSDDEIWWPRNDADSFCAAAEAAGWEVVEKDLNLIKRDSICVLRRPG